MATTNEIIFHSSFIPVLKLGTYSVEAIQSITIHGDKIPDIIKMTEFYVGGPKFELEAGMVHHVYPAAGMEGDFVADVPSIVFNRVTLPWERVRANAKSLDDSWLILFMVDEEEKKELEEGNGKAKVLFGVAVTDRHENDDVNFLKIPDVLTALFPKENEKENEYQYLSYCRIGSESDDEAGGQHEKSVILCNRLPRPGHVNTVYLLSLEHCKIEDGHKTYPYLYKWQFHCFDTVNYLIPKGSKQAGDALFPESLTDTLFDNSSEFEAALQTLDPKPVDETVKTYKSTYKISGGTFHGLLHRLPSKLASFVYPLSEGNAFVQQGGLVLKEGNGHKGYRGPLQAAPVPLLFSNNNSQWTGVKKYFPKGKYQVPADRSYQVAHELGILTALKDEALHKAFFEWKHEVSTALLMAKNSGGNGRETGHLSGSLKLNANKPLPPIVMDKVEGWKKLQGIPFSYLVPSSKMLPRESIRHFCVDVNWANAFILGAFSIGNTYDSVEQLLLKIYDERGLFLKANRYGFLIQSLAVSGWPDYEVDAVLDGPALQLLVRKKLAKNIEFFLYEGDGNTGGVIQKLAFHLPAGKTHSGFRFERGKFTKQFRKPKAEADTSVDVSFNDATNRVFEVEKLLKNAKGDLSPAYFGMMMLEGTPKVVFNIS